MKRLATIILILPLLGCTGAQPPAAAPRPDRPRAAPRAGNDAQRLDILWNAITAAAAEIPQPPRPTVYYDATRAFAPPQPDAGEGRGEREYPQIPGMVASEFLYLNHPLAEHDSDAAVRRWAEVRKGCGRPVVIDFAERVPGNGKWWIQQEILYEGYSPDQLKTRDGRTEVVQARNVGVNRTMPPLTRDARAGPNYYTAASERNCKEVIDRYVRFIRNLKKGDAKLEVTVLGVLPPREEDVEPMWRPLIRRYRQLLAPLVAEVTFVCADGYPRGGESLDGFKARVAADVAYIKSYGKAAWILHKPHSETPPQWTPTADPEFGAKLAWGWGEVEAGRVKALAVWAGGVDSDLAGAKELRSLTGAD